MSSSLRPAGLLVLAVAVIDPSPSRAAEPGRAVDFARDVHPILAEHCFACHGPDEKARKAKLRLDTKDGLLAVRGELMSRVTAADPAERMPPPGKGKPLSAAQVEVLKAWIDQGGKWAGHWSFIAPTRPPVARPRAAGWVRNPIDAFVLTGLEARGLSPSPEADRVTLIRRLSLDLTGLPPSPEEVDAFLADTTPGAHERVVDRLLASPRYGEHMARDWLDQARYADTHGYFTDHARNMWRWRDWVIRAYNRNLPFDQFTVEQLAGDLLPSPTDEQRVATGFNRNHMITEETGVFPEEYRTGYVADRVRTTAAVWMGLTAGCAQCHDHKFDPLTQREYYRLFAFFNTQPEQGIDGGQKGNAAPYRVLPTPEQAKAIESARQALRAAEARKEAADKLRELREVVSRLELAASVMVMEEMPTPRETFVLVRGRYDKPGEKVTPGVPAFLPPLQAETRAANRQDLAKWLVSPEHPLTARVAVNRLWRQLFGRGLVATPEDFGVRGERPTHPELLDWLAVEFRESGWDVKRLQRLIVTSATYRQSSAITPARAKADPQNRLLARAPRYRLDAETIRDSALFAGGLLAERLGGPSVKPYQPAGVWNDVTYDKKNTQTYEQDRGDGLYRRGMYTFWKRQLPPPSLWQLDAPNREVCTVRRQRTNTPLQALVLLNDPQFVEAARGLAQRVLVKYPAADDAARIEYAFRLAVARPPSDADANDLRRLVESERAHYQSHPEAARKLLGVGESPVPAGLDPAEVAAWTAAGNVLLNMDEFLTRE